MKELVTFLAIDRAEIEAGRAARKMAADYNLQAKAYMLVNREFKETPAYKGDETSGFFKEIVCDFKDTEKLQDILAEICNGKVVVHCRMEEAIKDYQKIIPLLPKGTLTQNVRSLELSTEKFKMRQAMAEKYPEICPKFLLLKSYEEFSESLIDDFNFPVIVKPNGLHSSFFVKKCQNVEETRKALRNAFAGLKQVYEREYGTGQPSLLIEEFMSGQMFSVDSYVDANGKTYHLPLVGVTIAAEVGLDGYYGYQYSLPVEINDSEINEALACCEKAIEALGLTSSVAHTELYKTPHGWKIIELGPRIGGYRQVLYREAYGIDHYYNDLLIHFGQSPNITQKAHKHALGLTIYADAEGTITSIHGIEGAKALESVVSVGLDTQVGNQALFASNGGPLLAIVILSNKDEVRLRKDAEKARELIKFDVS